LGHPSFVERLPFGYRFAGAEDREKGRDKKTVPLFVVLSQTRLSDFEVRVGSWYASYTSTRSASLRRNDDTPIGYHPVTEYIRGT
jgi:hypothetical protein